MRALVLFALLATSAAAQTAGLPRFGDYPAGPIYRGRVAPLVESSSRSARLYRTRTREALAGGVNFAGHYVVATWGCGTECMGGHIVDARTGRAVADLPFYTPFVTFEPGSRLVAVMTPDEIIELMPDGPIPSRYTSSYWTLENGRLRHLGSLLASDIEQIRSGGPTPALRTATPGDVLVPLAVGNTWTYRGTSPEGPVTVTYRVTRREPEPYATGFLVERTSRGAGGTRQTVETWTTGLFDGGAPGDGSLSVRAGEGDYSGFPYLFGVADAGNAGRGTERATVRVGGAAREAICYTEGPDVDGYTSGRATPARTCFVPRVGMVSREADGVALALTAHTLQ